MKSANYDVIIAGAGPVGLSLALRLARAKKKVLILEKNATTHEHSRAPAVWPKTQEILEDLGVINTCIAQGITLDHLRLHHVDTQKVLLDISFEEVKHLTKYPQLLLLPQSKTEHILCEAVKNTDGAEILFSSELENCSQDTTSVHVQYNREGKLQTATAQYLIGCDGAHSRVRDILGMHLQGETYSMKAALADVELETDSSFPLLSTKGVFVVAIKIDTTLWRLILLDIKGDTLSLDERIIKAMHQLFPGKDYTNIWKSEFSLHNRISSQFAVGRVVLAGDAAHLNSPVGGQGMNAGIQDAEILGSALIKAINMNDTSYISAYAKARRAAIQTGVNYFTNMLTKVLFSWEGRMFIFVVRVWNCLIKIPFIRRRFLKRLTMLGN